MSVGSDCVISDRHYFSGIEFLCQVISKLSRALYDCRMSYLD